MNQIKCSCILALFFLLASGSGVAQSVVWIHLNDKENFHNKNVLQVTEEFTMGSSVYIKYIKKFNPDNRVVSDERFARKNVLIAKLMYTYDPSTSLVSEFIRESTDKSGKPERHREKYQYNEKGWLTSITLLSSTQTNQISHRVRITHNEKGQPLKFERFYDRSLLDSDTLIYHDERNEVTCQQRDAEGNVYDDGFFTLDLQREHLYPKSGFEYNEHGDLIKYPNGYNEIAYDQFGNWISIKRYSIATGTAKLTQESKRLIKYRN